MAGDLFTPVIPTRLPDDTSVLKALKTARKNTVEIWPESLYTDSFIHRANVFGRNLILSSDPEVAQNVLLTHEPDFPKAHIERRLLRAITGDGLLTVEGDIWRRQRRAAAPVFRHKQLVGMVPDMSAAGEAAAARLLSHKGGARDVMIEMTEATLDIIFRTILSDDHGVVDPHQTAADVAHIIDTFGTPDIFDFTEFTSRLPRPWGRKARAAVKRLQGAAEQAMAARRASGDARDDLLGQMLSAQADRKGEGLSDLEIRDNLVTFIVAGHETTTLVLTWALYLLSHAPDWQERLAAEAKEVCGDGPVTADHLEALDLHDRVLNEAMRLYPPAAGIDRVALKDVEWEGMKIHKGEIVVLGIFPMHRHETLWQNPNAFDPDRFLPERSAGRHRFQFMPFSGGPHICIGARFAMMEAKAILASVLRKVHVAPQPGYVPYPRSRLTLRPLEGMPLIISERP